MGAVTIWQDEITIPTYGVGEQNKNPMFLEKRVYQGSSGKVYPHPVIDTIIDEKKDKKHTVVFIENRYIQIQIMPDIGGRIYRALDKTNNYDFVYYNRVIKPALVGLTGPWISGGIEFNWPQHHRPNTFGPVDYLIDDSSADRKTVWLGERDRINGTRVTTGISLYADSALIEIHSELYNPTGEPQSFLWWANPAVAVHDETQSIFPPDVHAVMDHGKRDVSKFPVATGTYYKMDYSRGVDISRYKNIEVPTSYMAYKSKYDFVGGYDYRAGAGILHIADHHVSPGKKQWTWGCGDFGKAWDRNLTDEDGPYIELMTGVYTDNQPDFTWLEPYEHKSFIQYFMPYKKVGEVKNASRDLVLGLDRNGGGAEIRVYAVKPLKDARISLEAGGKTCFETKADISPADVFEKAVPVPKESSLTLRVSASNAAPLEYTTERETLEELPGAARALGSPKDMPDNETLYLAALHLEQYRHATYEPEAYYLEGLSRNPHDIRINNAYGNLLFRQGLFEQARDCFEAAKKSLTRFNPNPKSGETFYNAGKAAEALGDEDAAFDAYYKAAWSDDYKSRVYLKLAQISSRKKNYEAALEFAKESLYTGYKNYKARAILTVIYRVTGRTEKAMNTARETLSFDPLDFFARHELAQLQSAEMPAEVFWQLLRGNAHNYIALAAGYAELGFYAESAEIIRYYITNTAPPYAMAWYYLAYWLDKSGDAGAEKVWEAAARADGTCCFPNSLDDLCVLTEAIQQNPVDAMAHYYLGCWFYDKKRYAVAAAMWEKSTALNPGFPTAHRNLGLYYANKQKDFVRAKKEFEKAFELDGNDARVFYELCELHKKMGASLSAQLALYEKHRDLVLKRDDLCVSYTEIQNALGKYEQALDLLLTRKFHPWEGGEGKVPAQHIEARIGIAKGLMEAGKYEQAVEELEKATVYYENFGEGKLPGAQENHIYYYMGLTLQKTDPRRSVECFQKAASGTLEPAGAMYYNDQPPHLIYYQGLALRALKREDEARSRFNTLIAYGEKNLFKKQVMDYFAVSLPDFLVFEIDLDEKNVIHCYYMMALGHLGLGQTEKARECFTKLLSLAPNHFGALAHCGGCFKK